MRRLVLVAGLLALIGLMFVQAVMPTPREDFLWRSVLDAGHVPLFAVFALLVRAGLYGWSRQARWRDDLLAFVLVVAIGALTEFAQRGTGRDADPMDLERNVLGGLAGLLLWRAWARSATGRRGGGPLRRVALVVVALGLAVLALLPPAERVLALRARQEAFPVLARFDVDWMQTFVAVRDAECVVTEAPGAWSDRAGEPVARLGFSPHASYPAVILREIPPDWSAHEQLVLEFFNTSERAVTLSLRVDDSAHNGSYLDRYNGRLEIAPGARTLRIDLEEIAAGPRDRRLDLRRVEGFSLFAEKPRERIVVYLAGIHLE